MDIPKEEKDPFKKFNMVRKTLATLEKEQIEEFKKGEELLEAGDIKRGIFLLEKIVFDDGLHVRDCNWALLLGKKYIELGMEEQFKKFSMFMKRKYPQFKNELVELDNRKELNK